MGVTPDLIRSENFTEVGEVLRRDVRVLIEKWSVQAVASQPQARRLHHDALHNDLPRFLDELGRSLAETDAGKLRKHCWPASLHGEQRWESGWSLGEVVRDYQILRLVLIEHLEEALERPLSEHESMAIGLCLDDAIAASVDSYVASREEYLRSLEQKRAEQDRRIQEELKRREEILEQADRNKNEFLATLSHELRNPLAPLRNVVSVLEVHKVTDPVLLQVREIISRQVHHMVRLVDDLMDVSRIAQGKLELRKERVDLCLVATQAGQAVEAVLADRSQQFHREVDGQPLWVEGDPARLTQVLANLLTNAAKYTDPGGQVWLKVIRDGDRATVRVRDNGIGIDAETLPHIFELFAQAERSRERSQGGLGIGLALVQRLVELHQGTITAHSAGLNQGSEFVVRLPLAPA
jgi:signal transduction histidine kinase